MAPKSTAPHAPVVRFRTGKQAGEQDHPFSWVITGRPNINNSSDSLADSNETHQSSVASVEGDNLAGEHASPTSRLRKATTAQVEPQIVHADDNLPLLGAQNASARKATLSSKGKAASPVTPTKQKSIVPSAFKFTKRSKSTGSPEPAEATAAMVPPVPTTPSSLRSAPIHARFAKANRESWIQKKKGYREVVQGPIIPSRRGAPTLSFITQEPEEMSPLTYVPALPSSSRSDGTKSPPSLERAMSPVQRAISPPMRMASPTSVKRDSPQLRVQSPAPSVDIEPALKTSTAIRIMYPKATKPAPNGPLPEPPVPALERAVSPVQRAGSTSPTSRAPNTKAGRALPVLPVSGKYQVTVKKREVTVTPPLLKVAPTSFSPVDETELQYAASAPTTPLRGRTELPQRSFTPAPPASSGLRRMPSLPRTRRIDPDGEIVRGREHPFPLRPVQRQRSAQQLQPAFRVEVEVDDPRINRVGFYMSPSGGAASATDIPSRMHLDVPRNPRGRSVDPASRISDAPPSMYSDVSFGDSIGEELSSRQLMSELEHDLRRQNLISNVGMLIVQDGRVIA